MIATVGNENSVMFYWQTIGTAPWHAEQVAGPNTTSAAPSIAQVGNSSAIATHNPADGSLMFYWQTIGTALWHAEQVAGDSNHLLGAIDRASRGLVGDCRPGPRRQPDVLLADHRHGALARRTGGRAGYHLHVDLLGAVDRAGRLAERPAPAVPVEHVARSWPRQRRGEFCYFVTFVVAWPVAERQPATATQCRSSPGKARLTLDR